MLGLMGSQVAWCYTDPTFADRETGLFEIQFSNLCEFPEILEAKCLGLYANQRLLVPANAVDRCASPLASEWLIEV